MTRPWLRTPDGAAWVLEAFVAANLAFLAGDIWLAHSMNGFAHPAEWLPFAFSCGAPLLLLPGLVRGDRARGLTRALGGAVGGASVLLGVAGLVFHLQGTFFGEQTLHNLVYTAPFAAPLAYAGLGLLLLLNRTEDPAGTDWARWVVLLAAGGFGGNLALALADHAQNGYFHPMEWIPVVAAAYGVAFLVVVAARPADRAVCRVTVGVMAGQGLVGVLGAVLHGVAIAQGPGRFWDNLVHTAPPFAPLLFADLAVLAGLGLWRLAVADASPAQARASTR